MPITLVSGLSTYGKSLWGTLHTRTEPRVFFHDPLTNYSNVVWVDSDQLIDLYESGSFEKNFRVGTYRLEDYDTLNDIAFLVGHCKLVTDECSVIFKRGGVLSESVRQTIFMGRHNFVDPIMMSQRSASIPVDLRSQATRLVSFRQLEPDDIKALRPYFGKDEAELLPTLARLSCYDYNNGNLQRYSIRDQVSRYLGINPPN